MRSRLIISDLGEINWIIGWAITRDHEARTLSISQTSYITASLQRYGFEDIRTLSTLMDPNIKLLASQSPQMPEEFATMKNKPYQEAVGTLMYASLGTHPDIAYTVGILSKFNEKPGLVHWNVLKRIYAYLAGTSIRKKGFGPKAT